MLAGDVNCDLVVDARDSLSILLYLAGLPFPAGANCPPIGAAL